jgi:aryl-phospho-beta-D-glucosidase BglC (GH1 family)
MPEGLDLRRMSELMDFIADQGFNSIRLLFNMEDWLRDPIIPQDRFSSSLNPELHGARYRQMFKVVIRAAARRQLLVLMACHRLRRSYASPEHPEAWPGSWNGLWWEDDAFPEIKVAVTWGEIAATFCSEWNFFAADLMNEPHMGYWGSDHFDGTTDAGVPWAEAHVDWSVGAARLGNSVLKKCSRVLIFVEGLLSSRLSGARASRQRAATDSCTRGSSRSPI